MTGTAAASAYTISLRGHYQNAYVTHDLDRAMDLAGQAFGLNNFSAFDVDMVSRTPSGAPAVAAPAASEAAAPAGFSVENTDLGTLLDNAAAKAVLTKHLPALVSNDQIAMARSMTLKQLQQFAGDAVTDEKLAAIQADLDKLPKP